MASIERHVRPERFQGCYRCDARCIHLVWNDGNLRFTLAEFLAVAVHVAQMRDVILAENLIRDEAATAPLPLGVM